MGEQYLQLGMSERISIMLMLEKKRGVRAIARKLGRSPSTISREINRQPYVRELPYEALRADDQADYMRWQHRNPRKLAPGNAVFSFVAGKLRRGWSPQQIAGRLKRMHPDDPAKRVSCETIYVALYALPRGELRRELLSCLRQGHAKRWKRSRGSRRREQMPDELRIAARPQDVEERLVPGHWEGDLLKGAYNRTAVGTLVERTSRLVMLARLPGLDALTCQQGFERLFIQMPEDMRKTLTYDRGSEMARHRELSQATGVRVYFADPYAPWQRGSNENANGLIRQYLPKGSDLSRHTQADLNRIAHLLNTRPRKVLAFRTPLEVFEALTTQAAVAAGTPLIPSLGSTERPSSLRPDHPLAEHRAQQRSRSAERDRGTRRRRRP